MLAIEREQKILDYLTEHHVASTQYLCDLTNSSLATVRRDLKSLADRKLLIRTHGGAQGIELSDVTNESYNQSTIFSCYAKDPQYMYKNSIAQKAVEFIQSNDTIFIGAGVTCNLLCQHLSNSNLENVMVVTTNVTAVSELVRSPHITTFLLGGTVHLGTNHIETLDDYTIQSLNKLFFDKAFFTVDGIDLNNGYSIINHAQLPLYNYLLSNTKEIYLLAHQGKYDKRTFTHLCSLDTISNVITNSDCNSNYMKYYQEHHVTVYTA